MGYKAIVGAFKNSALNKRLSVLWADSPTVTVTGVDLASAGTGTATIQVVDLNGTSGTDRVLVRTWIGQANDYGADALTDYSVTTGTQNAEVLANAIYDVVTDSTGKAVMAINVGSADSVWVWAEVGGTIVSSGEIILTAP